MENSILLSTKEVLGLDPAVSAFDLQILTHINTALGVVNQLGVGPAVSFVVIDDTAVWEDIWEDLDLPLDQLSVLKSYVFLRVQMLWDPPSTSFAIAAKESQLKEFEWRINAMREEAIYVPPVEPDI